jgi:thiamine-monophosphate kinase
MKKEIDYINSLIADYPKQKKQKNVPFHADAEILPHDGGFLGVSVDAVSEELKMGLIADPATLGWMTVTASVSDLAAVGFKTDRVSVLLKDSKQTPAWKEAFFAGALEACKTYQVSDCEQVKAEGKNPLTACTAYGWSAAEPTLSRMGLQKDDVLFLTGPIGWGNALAFTNVAIRKANPAAADMIDKTYRPKARWQEGLFIKDFARVCIDTSDGLLSTLKWLEILNKKQFELNYTESLFHKVALDVAKMAKVDPWLFMASQNGEFELLFAVPQKDRERFISESQKKGFSFLEVGRVLEGEGITLQCDDKKIPLQLGNLLDMLHDGVDPEKYILAMLHFSASNGIKLKALA